MPIYSITDVKALARQAGVHLANRRARTNAYDLGWEQKHFKAFVEALSEARHFQKSLPAVSIFDGRAKLDVDVYRMRFDEEQLRESSSPDHCVFYMKIGVRKLSDDSLLAVATFHLDGQP